jgi:hypothetical protein
VRAVVTTWVTAVPLQRQSSCCLAAVCIFVKAPEWVAEQNTTEQRETTLSSKGTV